MPKNTPTTYNAASIEFNAVYAAMVAKGYHIRQRGNYDVNVVGVRRSKIQVDAFNDVLVVFYPLNGQWQYQKFQITTLPGYTYLAERLGNSKGTAILVPGQYKDKYMVRTHGSGGFAHTALCHKKDEDGDYVSGIKVWRDDTLDAVPNPDKSKVHAGTGINIHRSDPANCAVSVSSYSAGCQVFRCAAQFAAFMAIIGYAKKEWSNSFTYTLLDEADL